MLKFIKDYIKYVRHVLKYEYYASLNIFRYYRRRKELNFWIECARDLRKLGNNPKYMSKQAWLDKYNTTNTLKVQTGLPVKSIKQYLNEKKEAKRLRSRIAK